ncbi:MAG: ABC transporter substrate-binding protein [Rhodocyclaceae bacterium]|jgi:phospholipid transport system substrate-binding protein|nr:ABC transporter substrate-binding protein [Rhodocyclaceae bacterium]MCL4756819.1 ABC transporter substrate-binding protein [Rhodocyclaceae bacterium]
MSEIKRLLRIGMMLLALCALPATAQEEPDRLVRELTNEVLDILRKDEGLRNGKAQVVADRVEKVVSPHFNFRRMTMLAVGRDWRQATPEQQGRLIDAFYRMLVRTYSNALTQYRDQTVEFRPSRMESGDTNVRVQTEIRQSGAQPIAVDYVLEKTEAGWKIFDVVVAGVSLVTNYRGSFAQEIRVGGIEGLIRALEAREREFSASGQG